MNQREAALAGEAAAKAGTGADFYAAMERISVAPLWDKYNAITPPEPKPHDPGIHWKWDELSPLIERACREVSVVQAERRVLMLLNPAIKNQFASTTGLYGAIQMLNPGETARPHRHTASAYRFILSGTGAYTVVDGQPHAMSEGDLILTPNWVWHEHTNPGKDRIVWFDGLDVPLIYFYNAWFGEHGPVPNDHRPYPVPDTSFNRGGLRPAQTLPPTLHSPQFRYAWADVRAALAAMPVAPDGSRMLQYVNPVSGGPVMPTMDLYALGLEGGVETRPSRSTSNAMCVVAEGEGTTEAGERRYEWKRGDIFTLPHWTWVSHKAKAPGAKLFLSTDRALLRYMGLLREEQR